MTKAITDRPLMRPGRKLKEPPLNVSDQVESLAADGWSIIGIARKLGTTPLVLRRWMDENPDISEAMKNGREVERWQLHNALFKACVERGNIIAGIFLLKARHNYRENERELVTLEDKETILSELAKRLPV